MNTFDRCNNAKALGIDITKKFILVDATGCINFKPGDIFELAHDDDSYCPNFRCIKTGVTDYLYWYRFAYAPEPNRSIKDVLIGDVIVSRGAYYRKVLDFSQNGIIVHVSASWPNNSTPQTITKCENIVHSSFTKTELENDGWSIVQPKQEPEVQEMTVEEVSKLVGKTVKIVEKKT